MDLLLESKKDFEMVTRTRTDLTTVPEIKRVLRIMLVPTRVLVIMLVPTKERKKVPMMAVTMVSIFEDERVPRMAAM